MPVRYTYLNNRNVPERKPAESESDFAARMNAFRKTDRRIAFPNGKKNYGFAQTFDGTGVMGRRDFQPKIRPATEETPADVFFDPFAGGSFSQAEP